MIVNAKQATMKKVMIQNAIFVYILVNLVNQKLYVFLVKTL